MARVIRARFEGGVLRPLEPVGLREGEEVEIVVIRGGSIADKFYGVARRRRPGLGRSEFLEVLEEIESEGVR